MAINEKEMSLWFNDFVFDGNDIIFSAACLNGLFRANMDTGQAELLGLFPEEKPFRLHLFSGVHKYKENLLFMPAWGKYFTVYNIKLNKFYKLSQEIFPAKEAERMYAYKYNASISVGKYVYVFGYALPEICRVNMETFEIRYYDKWLDELYKYGKNDAAPFFYKDVCLVGQSLYVASGQNNSILELDMNLDKIRIHPIENLKNGYNTLTFDGNYFWLTEKTKRILKVNPVTWEFKCMKMQYNIRTDYFISSIIQGDTIFLYANRVEDIYRINTKTSLVEKLEVSYVDEDEWYPNVENFGYVFGKKLTENRLAAWCVQDCRLHIIEKNKPVKNVRFFIDEKTRFFYEKKAEMARKVEDGFQERDQCFYRLSDLLHYMGYIGEPQEHRIQKAEIGKSIYSFIKKELL